MASAWIDAPADPTPGSRGYLKWYWTKGDGRKKWVGSPHPWRTLRSHLVKYIPATYVDNVVSQWYKDVFGIWVGETKGSNPAGPG